MEKIKRVIAYTLVFALVFGLFAGLGLYGGSQSEETLASAAGSGQLVWEIVPVESAASAASVLTGATVETYTPGQLRQKLATEPNSIDDVDMFIINQNGQTGSSNSFFAASSGADNWLQWEETYAIFKKIAGANGTPAKYAIDASIYTSCSKNDTDSQGFALASTNWGGRPYGNNSDLLPLSISGDGFTNNAAKLFVMLQIMDPGTFYGIYFASRGETYGINENNGALIGYGYSTKGASAKESGHEVLSWSLPRLRPYFMLKLETDSLSDIGWNESNLDAGSYVSGSRGFAFTGSLSSNSSALNSVLGSSLSFALDAKQYRFLVVEPNEKKNVDRSIIYEMAKLANSASPKQSMVGGVSVDIVSMYNLQSYVYNLEDKYDCIYFGTASDSNRSGMKEGITYTFRDKQYTKIGSTYELKIGRYDNPSWSNRLDWTSSENKNSKYSGLDLTDEKKTELQNFISSGKVVVYNGILDTTKVDSDTNIYTVINGSSSLSNVIADADGSLSSTELDNIKSLIKDRLSIVLIEKPVEYYSKVEFDYKHWDCKPYDYNTINRTTGVQYINETDPDNRTLYFKLRVSGAEGSYKYRFYIDANNDGRFSSGENKQSGDLTVVDGITSYSYSVGSGFSGALNWKLEVYDSADIGNVFSESGVCAVRSSSSPKTLNILQIIPVDDGNYSATDTNFRRNPTLLLPMKDEIRAAEKERNELSTSGVIDDDKKDKIESYFDGCLKIQTSSNTINTTNYNYCNFASKSYTTVDSSYAGGSGALLVANAGLFYYFVKKSNICDLNVLRISFEELANRMSLADSSPYKIKFDGNKITYLDPDGKTQTVTCDLLMLGFCDYLTNQNSTITSTSAQGRACDAIADYIAADGPTFIGGGVLQPNENDYLTRQILNACGLDRYGITTGNRIDGAPGYTIFGSFYNSGNDAAGELMKTNEGAIVSYPYTIPNFTYGANTKCQTFQTNVDALDGDNKNDISVFFTLTNVCSDPGNYVGFNSRGDVVNDYYLFKKGNLTYSAVGFNELSASQMYDMKSTVIKLPEAALLVNALVATTSGDPGHTEDTKKAPYIVPKDNPGSNETPVEENVPYMPTLPSGGTDSSGMKYNKHNVYVYPEYDATKENVTDLIANNPSISDGKFKFTFEVQIPAGSESVKIDVFAGGKNISLPIKKADGTTVTNNTINKSDSGEKFYVEIPINSDYYNSQGLNSGSDKYGLDLTDNFMVKIVTTPNFASPSTTTINGTITDVHVVKRGIFRIN